MRREQMHMVLDVLLDMGQKLAARQTVAPEAKQHFTAARKEILLGLRTMVDTALDRIDANSAAPQPSSPAAIKIE